MYHALVRPQLTRNFAALSRVDYDPSLAGMARPFEHGFAGTPALGGRRHTATAMRRWFGVAVYDGSWDTNAVEEWRDTATLADGDPYVNDGTRVARGIAEAAPIEG